jgi:hypothetical protein
MSRRVVPDWHTAAERKPSVLPVQTGYKRTAPEGDGILRIWTSPPMNGAG